MASNIKGITIEIGGNTVGLNKALTEVNKQSRDIQKELKEVERLLKLDPKNTELLAQKQKLLGDSVNANKEKLEALKLAQEKADKAIASGTDISEEQYRKLQREIVSTEQSLEKLEGQAKKTSKSFDTNSPSMQKMDKAANGILGGAAVVSAGLGAMAFNAVENADELQRLSDITGLSTDRLQELKYIGVQLGVELDTITGAQAKLTKSMSKYSEVAEKVAPAQEDVEVATLKVATAQKKLEEIQNKSNAKASEILSAKTNLAKAQSDLNSLYETGEPKINAITLAFQKLGVKVRDDTTGQLRDSKVVMQEALTALNKVGNETERDSLAMQIFGKSAMDLNPLIKAGGGELNKMTEEARKNGSVMSNEAVKGLDAFGDTVESIKNSVMAQLGEKMKDLLPEILKILDGVKKFVTFLFQNFKTVSIFTGVIVGLALAFKGLIFVTTVIEIFKKYDIIAKIVTATQAIQNAVIAANPYVLLASVIAGVIAVMGTLYFLNKDAKNGYDSLNESQKKGVDTVNEQAESYKNLKKEQDEKATNDLIEVANSQKLWEELKTLVDSKGKVKEADKERVGFINGELNKAYGLELKLIGDTVTGLDDAAKSIDKLIEKKKAQIWLESKEPLYAKAQLEIDKVADQQLKNRIALEKQRQKVEELKQFAAELKPGQVRRNQALYEIKEEEKRLKDLEESYNKGETLLKEHAFNIDIYEKAMGANSQGNTAKVVEILGAKNTAYNDTTAVVGKSKDDQRKILEQKVIDTETLAKQEAERFKAGQANVTEKTVAEARVRAVQAKTELSNLGNEAGGALVDGMNSGVNSKKQGFFATIGSFLVRLWNGIMKNIQDMYNKAVDFMNSFTPGKPFTKIKWVAPEMPMLAKGGVLHNGQAIVAEAGPEMIQQINGRTIVTPLSSSSRNTALNQQQNQPPIIIHTKTYLDKKEIGYSVAEYVDIKNTFEKRRVFG
jgi:hypothetical protein